MWLNKTLLIIQENSNRYFCPICLIFGLIGCFFNILLFSQKQFRRISCCTYFLGASVVMFIALIVGFVPHIYSFDGQNLSDRIVIYCKIRGYLGQSLAMMYRWLMIMACIDRYIVSSDNVYLREFADSRIAYSILIKVLIICTIIPVHNLIFLDTKENWCQNSSGAFALYHSLFTFLFGGLLPILIMILSVILIRSNLALKQARLRCNISCQNKDERIVLIMERDHQVVVMLFIQIIFYILSTIPWMILLFYSSYTYNVKNKSINRRIIENFFRYVTEIIIYLYPTLSFYIYTLTSKTFRNELINIISSLFKRRNRSQYVRQSLLIQSEVLQGKNIQQSNEIDQCQSVQMETFLDSSTKIDSC